MAIGANVERFVREVVIPYERDPRRDHHGAPLDELVMEMRSKARNAGVLTPHILPNGSHLTQLETAFVLQKSGLSPLGPLAVNTMAPDEGNMYLLGHVGSPEIKERFLKPLVDGAVRSAFFMTEPASEGGAGSDPSMMKTTCRLDGNHWVINGRKAFITGADGARVGEVAGGEDERVLGAHPVRQLALELEVQRRGAVHEARPGQAGAVVVERRAGRRLDARVAGQPEVVV